jgi:O-antigen ligase
MRARLPWVVGVVAAGSPLIAWVRAPEIGLVLSAAVLALVVTAAIRPAVALAWLAALIPVGVPVGVLVNATAVPLPQLAEGLALAVIAGACIRHGCAPPPSESRLGPPALAIGVIVAAGAVVALAVPAYLAGGVLAFAEDVLAHLTGSYFIDPQSFAPWHEAAYWVEAVTLAMLTERAVRASAPDGSMIRRALLVGLTATATFSVLRLAEVALASGVPGITAWRLLTTARISPHLPDVNALGTWLALLVVVWTLVAVRRSQPWPHRLMTIAALGISALALWLTGSRSAQAAAIVGCGWGLWPKLRASRSLRVGALVVGLAAIAAIAWMSPGRMAQSGIGAALGVRLDMARVSLQVAQQAPVFGVGPGGLRDATIPHVAPDLIARFPQTAAGENAHNQLLQVLAEFGGVGLVAVLWLLWAGLGSGHDRARIDSTLAVWRAGWVALLLSALLGHPFLMPTVLLVSFLSLGMVAGLAPRHTPARSALARRGLAAVALLIVATVPLRSRDVIRSTDLDHLSIGAGPVAGALDDVPYRRVRATSTWFVRVSARAIQVPLRLDPGQSSGADTCRVTVLVDRLPANLVEVGVARWETVRFTLTAGKYRQVNRRIDIQAPDHCRLLVGAFTIRD